MRLYERSTAGALEQQLGEIKVFGYEDIFLLVDMHFIGRYECRMELVAFFFLGVASREYVWKVFSMNSTYVQHEFIVPQGSFS